MSTNDGPLGPSNRWYREGFKNLWTVTAKEQVIQILPSPCYLATKFEAFNNRGKDYRTSHDIEDIVNIMDNRISIAKEIRQAQENVRPTDSLSFGEGRGEAFYFPFLKTVSKWGSKCRRIAFLKVSGVPILMFS